MNHRSPRFIIPFVLAVLFLGATARAAPTAMPQSHHGAADGYRVGLPLGWVTIPEADVATRFRAARKAGAPNTIRFDSAFQAARGRRSFEYPYVIVQVVPYGSLGLNGQVSEAQFPDVVRRMTGTNLRLSQAQSLKSGARLDAPVLERSQRRYWMTGEITVAGPGPVRTLIAGYFGREAIVQVCFHARAVDVDRHAATGRRICESLTFDPEKAYPVPAAPAQPAPATEAAANPAPANPTAANPTPRGGSDGSFWGIKVAIGVACGIAAGVVSHAVRQRQRRLRIKEDEIDPATNRPRPW